MNEINFNIEDIENINFDLGVAVKEIAPSLENLNVIPTREQQIFTHENSYGYDTVTVEPYTPNVSAKTITENGIYNASDDNLDGYSSVEVATSGVDINEYFGDTITYGDSSTYGVNKLIKKLPNNLTLSGTSCAYMFARLTALEEVPFIDTSEVTDMNHMFYYSSAIKEIPLYNTSKVTNMSQMCQNCKGLTSFPQLDTSNVTNTVSMFYSCSNITSFPQLNTSKVTNMGSMFNNCFGAISIPELDASSVISLTSIFGGSATPFQLTNFGGLKNLGKAYLTTQSENYRNYTFDLSYLKLLTHDSLMNVINNLYDIKTKGCKNQSLVLGSTNKAKLTEEEIAIATNKGWNVS